MKTLSVQSTLSPTQPIDPIEPPVVHGPGGGINLISPAILDGIIVKPVGMEIDHTGSLEGETLYGSDLNDEIYGGMGKDTLYGGAGDDRLMGFGQDDMLVGGEGADVLGGGSGSDWAGYHTSVYGVIVDLLVGQGFGGHAEGDILFEIENLLGSSHADVLRGDAYTNTLMGGGGNDEIVGGHGSDRLVGGAGSDILMGDALDGLAYSDTFVLERGSGVDVVIDFQGGFDKVDVDAFGFGGAAGSPFGLDGELASGSFDEDGNFIEITGLDQNDRFFFDEADNLLWECRVDPDGTVFLLDRIAEFRNGYHLTVDDFIL
jgi:Ca2+-binding RTX toxin-like protein